MSAYHMINRNDETVNVRTYEGTIIGTIGHNECYILVQWGNAIDRAIIKFMNSAGNLVWGYLPSNNDLIAAGISPPGLFQMQKWYWYDQKEVWFHTKGTYNIIRDTGVFTLDGVWCGTLHPGDKIANAEMQADDTYMYMTDLDAWYDASEGIWKYERLLVDTGILDHPTNPSVHGDWE